jgi:hypothetical protein
MDTNRPAGLLEGEEVVAMMRVRFTGGLPTNIDPNAQVTMRRQTMIQRRAYAHWARRAAAAGFPIAGPEMILGVTKERLIVWRPRLFGTRPKRFAGALSLSRIDSASVHRKLFASALTLLFDNGAIVGVEATRTSRLRQFAAAIPTYIDHKAR